MWFVVDAAGLVCVPFAYSILGFSSFVVLSRGMWPWGGDLGYRIFCITYQVLVFMAIWSHLACMLSDPGSVPKGPELKPGEEGKDGDKLCTKCEAPKPARAHHCKTCGRCIMKMDHHCPWVNNCVGQRNQKFFLLFLFYVLLMCWGAGISMGARFAWLAKHPELFHPRSRPGRGAKLRGAPRWQVDENVAAAASWVQEEVAEEFLAVAGQAPLHALPRESTMSNPKLQDDGGMFPCMTVFFVAVFFGLFCTLMLIEQLTNIATNTTMVEYMKQKQPECRPWRESMQEVMGRGPSFRWFLPIPVRPMSATMKGQV